MADHEGQVMTTEAPLLYAGEILKATGGSPFTGGSEWSCHGISTDTRTLRTGNLFIALPGKNFDGHDCLTAAAEKGAAGLLIRMDRGGKLDAGTKGLPVIGVPDTRRHRLRLAEEVFPPGRRDNREFGKNDHERDALRRRLANAKSHCYGRKPE
jgi:UDP-N-acetylmuramyl tripeptide synthase